MIFGNNHSTINVVSLFRVDKKNYKWNSVLYTLDFGKKYSCFM